MLATAAGFLIAAYLPVALTLLVEVQQGELQAQKDFMGSCGYTLIATHVSGTCKPRQKRGWSLHALACNALFEPIG